MATLTLELPAGIIYVAGRVNGVLTVFHQDGINPWRWRASVDAAEDSLYHICLEMHDEAGNVGHYEKVLEYILPVFVFDRTAEDARYAKKLQEAGWKNMTEEQRKAWRGGLKGCLNASDLKRMENAVHVIGQLLRLDLKTNKDSLPEFPDTLYFRTLLRNVSRLRETGYLHRDTPQLPEEPLNTWQKVNDLEHILHDIYAVYNANNSRHKYCGEICSGEENGLL